MNYQNVLIAWSMKIFAQVRTDWLNARADGRRQQSSQKWVTRMNRDIKTGHLGLSFKDAQIIFTFLFISHNPLFIKVKLENTLSVNLFITGDSGPMHLSAAFKIPTISIFGPTNHHETSQWMNKKNIIVKKNLECQPCMKRTCPLKHHKCMRLIESSEVLEAVNRLN